MRLISNEPPTYGPDNREAEFAPHVAKTPGCAVCKWDDEKQQDLIVALSSPDNMVPFDKLCRDNRVSGPVLAAHIGICLRNHFGLYLSQRLAEDAARQLYDGLIQAMGSSLGKAAELLKMAVEKKTAPAHILAKSYTDLHRAEAAAAQAIAQDVGNKEVQARITLMEHRLRQNLPPGFQDPLSGPSGGSVSPVRSPAAKSRKVIALIEAREAQKEADQAPKPNQATTPAENRQRPPDEPEIDPLA